VFDSHCHPTDIDDPVAVVESARTCGVRSLLACGYNAQSNKAVLGLRSQVPGLPIAIGLHPWFATEDIDGVAELIRKSYPTAIVECGLDATADESMAPLVTQRKVFESQLEIAGQLKLPVTVHSRRAVASVVEIICDYPQVRGVMHAFGGSYEQAKQLVDRGWLIGLGGAVTRPNARRVHGIACRLPLEAIVLETDAPAIGLEGVAVPNVRPAHLLRIAAALAELRNIEVSELIEETDKNVARIFGSAVLRWPAVD
jgi:TatD DNase family protein